MRARVTRITTPCMHCPSLKQLLQFPWVPLPFIIMHAAQAYLLNCLNLARMLTVSQSQSLRTRAGAVAAVSR